MNEYSPNESDDNFALTKLLKNSLIYLSYVRFKSKSKNYRSLIISWIYLISMTLWGIRYIILLSILPDNVLVYYLCDSNFMLGDARTPLNTILGGWVNATVFCGYYLKLTQFFPPKFYESWIKFSDILSTRYYRGAGPFDREVTLFYWVNYSSCIITGIATFIQNCGWFFFAPQKYWLFGIVLILYHAVVGYHITFVFLGRAAMHTFHLYVFGKYFQHLKNQLIASETTSVLQQSEFNSKFSKSLTECLKEMKLVNNYYSFLQSLLFLVAFFSQIFVYYCVFFSDLLIPIKLAFITFGNVNYGAALSVHFFAGSFLNNKV